MSFAKLVQFQYAEKDRVIFALDIDGRLWKNVEPHSSKGWTVVPGPTLRQHMAENMALSARDKFDISEHLR